ncbi:MAG: S-layer homology domain-containing protein [Cellulosilyticaceae bacterium]
MQIKYSEVIRDEKKNEKVQEKTMVNELYNISTNNVANKMNCEICGNFLIETADEADTKPIYDEITNTVTFQKGKHTIRMDKGDTKTKIIVDTQGSKDIVNIELDSVNIDVSEENNACAFEIKGNSSVNLTILKNTINNLKSADNRAGLQVGADTKEEATLVIKGDGVITIEGGNKAAGIGGSSEKTCGTISITEGTVKAIGGEDGAGIGGGYKGNGGNINVTGGTVIASSKDNGAGIGGGYNGNGGIIKIEDGIIRSVSENNGAGIGGGYNGDGGSISIIKGVVVAKSVKGGAGIGGGYDSAGGSINIFGGSITAIASTDGAGIGGGYNGEGGTINISGGEITAKGAWDAAGIGGGTNKSGGNINISGGEILCAGGFDAAGIGSGCNGNGGGNIVISGGRISSEGGYNGAGIGGGARSESVNITIKNNAIIRALGGVNAAAIGGGVKGKVGTINIIDKVNLRLMAGMESSVIGSGNKGETGTIKIGDEVTLVAVNDGSRDIIETNDNALLKSKKGKVANIIIVDYAKTIDALTKTEVCDKNGSSLPVKIEIKPVKNYKAIAFTVLNKDEKYTILKNGIKQINGRKEKKTEKFTVKEGINLFANVRSKEEKIYNISGTIEAKKTKEGIPATIYLKQSVQRQVSMDSKERMDGNYRINKNIGVGVKADKDGKFVINGVPEGKEYLMDIVCEGYHGYRTLSFDVTKDITDKEYQMTSIEDKDIQMIDFHNLDSIMDDDEEEKTIEKTIEKTTEKTTEKTIEIVKPVKPVKNIKEFKDISEKQWFYQSVKIALEKGWFAGTSKTTFSPNLNVTRGMLAAVLWNIEKRPIINTKPLFDDIVEGVYYFNAMIWASEKHLISGYGLIDNAGGKLFGPRDNVTIEQMAVIMYRYANYKKYDTTITSNDRTKFKDEKNIAKYAITEVEWALSNKLIVGKNNKELNPKGYITRAEVVAIIVRFDEMFSK